jgi:hypothetical protein
MKRLWVGLCAALLTALLAAPVSAEPRGRGLESFGPAQCEGLGEVTFTTTRGSAGPGWIGDDMYVLQSIAATFSATFPDGSTEEESFSQSFGNKKGLGEPIACSAQFEGEEDGIFFSAHFDLWIVRVK